MNPELQELITSRFRVAPRATGIAGFATPAAGVKLLHYRQSNAHLTLFDTC